MSLVDGLTVERGEVATVSDKRAAKLVEQGWKIAKPRGDQRSVASSKTKE